MMSKLSVLIFALLFVSCRDQDKENSGQVNIGDSTNKVSNSKAADGLKASKKDSASYNSEIELSTDPEFLQLASVGTDSIIRVNSDIKLDYRIFGFEKPDTTSKKMILFSVFTPDVENNPYKCPYGSYYGSPPHEDMEIKFISKEGDYVKASIRKHEKQSSIYFHKKWIEFQTPLSTGI